MIEMGQICLLGEEQISKAIGSESLELTFLLLF